MTDYPLSKAEFPHLTEAIDLIDQHPDLRIGLRIMEQFFIEEAKQAVAQVEKFNRMFGR